MYKPCVILYFWGVRSFLGDLSWKLMIVFFGSKHLFANTWGFQNTRTTSLKNFQGVLSWMVSQINLSIHFPNPKYTLCPFSSYFFNLGLDYPWDELSRSWFAADWAFDSWSLDIDSSAEVSRSGLSEINKKSITT